MTANPTLLYVALSGMLDQLTVEQANYRQRANQAIRDIQSEHPDWTPSQSSGHVAALRAKADTLATTIYRLRRLLDQVGDK